MKIINIVIYVMIITASQSLFGQLDKNKTEEAFLQQIESSASSLPLVSVLDFSNMAQIQQMGNNNDASIIQTLVGVNVPGNIADLIQHGSVNDAVLTQTGYGDSHFINQSGKGNMFEASVIGDNNSSTIDQFGNDNMINQNLLGNDMAFILSQHGNNNEIIQVENDQIPRQYEIYQRGNAMSITIINGGVLP